MDTYATYNKRRAGYIDVLETVKTLEKVAASQLRELEQRTKALQPYTKEVRTVLSRLDHLSQRAARQPLPQSASSEELLLILTGDKGLVGDLWDRLYINYEKQHHDMQEVLVIGDRGQMQFPKETPGVGHYSFADRLPTEEEVRALGRKLYTWVRAGHYARVSVLYVHAVSVVEQEPTLVQLLPLENTSTEAFSPDRNAIGNPIIEGSVLQLRPVLFERYVYGRLLQLILETAEAEYAARTIAMEHASGKTEEMIKHLVMLYSRERRHIETRRQLERFTVSNNI